MIYTGIGSREITEQGIADVAKVAKVLDKLGYILRSGGADGADKAFEENHTGDKEIYLPWKGFNNNESKLYNITADAEVMAMKYHPLGKKLKFYPPILKLMARNGYQVLGEGLNKPTNLIVCWTPSKYKGGTSQALRIARNLMIPYFNLADEKSKDLLFKMLDIRD